MVLLDNEGVAADLGLLLVRLPVVRDCHWFRAGLRVLRALAVRCRVVVQQQFRAVVYAFSSVRNAHVPLLLAHDLGFVEDVICILQWLLVGGALHRQILALCRARPLQRRLQLKYLVRAAPLFYFLLLAFLWLSEFVFWALRCFVAGSLPTSIFPYGIDCVWLRSYLHSFILIVFLRKLVHARALLEIVILLITNILRVYYSVRWLWLQWIWIWTRDPFDVDISW